MNTQEHDVAGVDRTVKLATESAFSCMHSTGYWSGEVVSDVTFTAEYVFLRHILGSDFASDGPSLKHWILSRQQGDGSWTKAPYYPGDTSTSTEAYLSLRILGVPESHPAMRNARDFIRRSGGIETVRMFTRFYLAMFGLFPWDAVPQLPAEIMLMPTFFPINIYSFAYWARGCCIPMLVIRHHQPKFSLPVHLSVDCLDSLWIDAGNKNIPYCPSFWSTLYQKDWISSAFIAGDKFLSVFGGFRRFPLRDYCLKSCISWIIKRQDRDGGWGGIWPMMVGCMIALLLEGYPISHPTIAAGRRGIETYAIEDSSGKRMQCCNSAVWDTALMVTGLCDAGVKDPRLGQAVRWILDRQILTAAGDWQVYNPELPSGGWAFQHHNDTYPDTDDTAAAIVALLKAESPHDTSVAVTRGIVWLLGMQNRDGGWSTYDRDNNYAFLNKIPFADAKNMVDPSTPDVTGHILECLGVFLSSPRKDGVDKDIRTRVWAAVNRALKYLASTQEPGGAWWGRWGVNYVYGTSNVLCALGHFKDEVSVPEMVERAIGWLRSVQNADGGWGEGLDSYKDPTKAGKWPSTPSQTAWGVMALLPFSPPEDASIKAGVSWIIHAQTTESDAGATWREDTYTAVGFPDYHWLTYSYYPHYFPLTALGRYRKAIECM